MAKMTELLIRLSKLELDLMVYNALRPLQDGFDQEDPEVEPEFFDEALYLGVAIGEADWGIDFSGKRMIINDIMSNIRKLDSEAYSFFLDGYNWALGERCSDDEE